MPVKIPETLPAKHILESENIFVMGEQRATHQDIRPLKIAILNLMPTKVQTETQILRLIGNTPLQVEIRLLHSATHVSTHTPAEHLLNHYRTIEQVQDEKFDGLIITGAPVEHLEFEQVEYWRELEEIIFSSTILRPLSEQVATVLRGNFSVIRSRRNERVSISRVNSRSSLTGNIATSLGLPDWRAVLPSTTTL